MAFIRDASFLLYEYGPIFYRRFYFIGIFYRRHCGVSRPHAWSALYPVSCSGDA